MISVGTTSEDPDPDGGSTSLNALAFSTLLSSQETDAHHRKTLISHPGLISLFCFDHRRGDLFKLPEMIFPVKSAVPIKSGRSSLYALPGSHTCWPLQVVLAKPTGPLECSGTRSQVPWTPPPGGALGSATPGKHPDGLHAQVRRVRCARPTTTPYARWPRQAEPGSVRTTDFDLV
jgi:hypothetical protein